MKMQKHFVKEKEKAERKEDKKRLFTSSICVLGIIISFFLDKILINIVNAVQYPLLFDFFKTITTLGEIHVFAVVVFLLTVILLIFHRPVIVFILSIGAAGVSEIIIKSIIQRPRPFEAMNIGSAIVTDASSFPSGHTMIFFSIVPMMSKNFPKIKILFWTLAVLVGISRIYLGVHYFSDVVAGAIFGYVIGWIFMKIGEKHAWKY